ncbi:MAG: hypothetical protein ACREDE_09910, partial [Thermoplasmata archaeon]
AGLAAIALIVRADTSRTNPETLQSRVPELWLRRPALEGGIAVLVLAKLMLDPSNLGYGAIVAVALAAAILLGRYLTVQEARAGTAHSVSDAGGVRTAGPAAQRSTGDPRAAHPSSSSPQGASRVADTGSEGLFVTQNGLFVPKR